MARPSATKPHKDDERQIICTNRKARHDYTIIETFESGIELRGTEVKSLRDAKAQLVDAYAMVENGELYLKNAHISIYDPGSYTNHEPTRPRRLLMHRAEPLSLYFRRGKVKVELALVKGRRSYDKRAKLDERRSRREIRGIMRGERPE